MRILFVSHSSRPFFEARARLNALEARFRNRTLDALPPLETFPGVETAVPFTGALSVWEIAGTARRPELRFLREYDPGYKIQSAAIVGNRLLVYGADRLEELNTAFELRRTISHPWLAGGHTIFPAGPDHVWVNSAPANCLLRIHVDSGEVVERRAVPAVYGAGYRLSEADDLRRHFIPTDYQPTHVNCAVPGPDGLLITLWIQGAAGVLGGDGGYREIAHGFRGCHGARPHPETGEIVLADSPAGIIWYLDAADGAIRGRLDLASEWLHDAEPLGDGLVVATLSDSNEILIVDEADGEVLFRQDCGAFGASAMFVNVYDVDGPWRWQYGTIRRTLQRAFGTAPEPPPPPVEDTAETTGEDLIAALVERGGLHPMQDEVSVFRGLRSARPVATDFLLIGESFALPAATYLLDCAVACRAGRLALGIVQSEDLGWISQCTFDAVQRDKRAVVTLERPVSARLVVSANNADRPEHVDADIERLSLKRIAGTEAPPPAARRRKVARRRMGPNLLGDLLATADWYRYDTGAVTNLSVASTRPVSYEYIAQYRLGPVEPGDYVFEAEVKCLAGGLSIGMIDSRTKDWLVQAAFDAARGWNQVRLALDRRRPLTVVVAAYNPHAAAYVAANLVELMLCRVLPRDGRG